MSKVDETGDIKTVLPNNNSNKNTRHHNFVKLSNLRIIQKKLVYVIGLSYRYAFNEPLSNFEFFGQYGRITKLVVNKNKLYNANGPNGASYSAYITFSSAEEASLAILSLDNAVVDNHLIRASFGTTKYCSNFLKGIDCYNKDCLYLHYSANESDIIERGDMNTNKAIFLSQHIFAMKIADIFNERIKKALISTKTNKTNFPPPAVIFEKEIVQERMKFLEKDSLESLGYEETKKYNMNKDTSMDNFNSLICFSNYNNYCQNFAKSNLFIEDKNELNINLEKKKNNSTNNLSLLNKNDKSLTALNSFNYQHIPSQSESQYPNKKNYNVIMNSLNYHFFRPNGNQSLSNGNFSLSSNKKFNLETMEGVNNIGVEFKNNFSIFAPNFMSENSQTNKNNLLQMSHDSYFGKINTNSNSSLEKNFLELPFENNKSFILTNNFEEIIKKNQNINNYLSSSEDENISFANSSKYNKLIINENDGNSVISFDVFNSKHSMTRKVSEKYENNNLLFSNHNKFFSKRKNSRFFNNDNEMDLSDIMNSTADSVHVPDFISDLISKKISRFTFFKNFIRDDEEINYDYYLLKGSDEDSDWMKFISSIKKNDIDDFAFLNKFNSV